VQAEYGQVHATGKKSNLTTDEDLLLQVTSVQAEQHQHAFPNLKQYR
jgi:microcompartment protein CcmK/EutM